MGCRDHSRFRFLRCCHWHDVDAIRASGRFTDQQLLAAAVDRDPGFEVGMFAQQLADAARLQPAQVSRYGVSPGKLEALKSRYEQWARALRQGREPSTD